MSEPIKRRGLPVRVKMRHGAHFVEELAARNEVAVGKMIPLSAIEPNRAQPRRDPGDLDDLIASVRSKGVLEPILVRRDPTLASGAIYQIIAGERRYRAAQSAGLFEIPAIELEVSEEEALEITLIENLQRKDLDPFEEADGYQALIRRYGYTHAQVAEAVGRSRTLVTELLSLLDLPEAARNRLAHLQPSPSRSVLLELARAKGPEELERLLDHAVDRGATRDDLRRDRQSARPAATRRKPYTFKFRSPDRTYNLALQFRQATVDREDLIRALECVLADLRKANTETP